MTYTLARGTSCGTESLRYFKTMRAAREAAENDYKYALGGRGRLVWKPPADDMEAFRADAGTTHYTIRPLKVEG